MPLPRGRPVFEGALGYVHLDLDALDPDTVGAANTHPVPGGLSVAETLGAIAAVRARMPIGAFTIASYAPEYDGDQAVFRAAFAAIDAVLGRTLQISVHQEFSSGPCRGDGVLRIGHSPMVRASNDRSPIRID